MEMDRKLVEDAKIVAAVIAHEAGAPHLVNALNETPYRQLACALANGEIMRQEIEQLRRELEEHRKWKEEAVELFTGLNTTLAPRASSSFLDGLRSAAGEAKRASTAEGEDS